MHTTAITSETPYTEPVQQAILPWLDMLRQLYPPSALLLVGAGNGRSPWVQYLMAANYDNVTLVEAEETAANHLKVVTRPYPTWRVQPKLVASNNALTTFYTASLPAESSLLAPETLRSLWPHITTLRRQTRQATTLAKLQQDSEMPANWLLVDCLPAVSILQGDTLQLAAFDVVALRTLLNSTNSDTGDSDKDTQSSSINKLQADLQTFGFRCLAIETSRHPFIGHALFVRDTVAQARQLQRQLDQQAQIQKEQASLAEQKKSEIDTVVRALTEQKNLTKNGISQIQQLSRENNELRMQAEQLKNDLLKSRVEVTKENVKTSSDADIDDFINEIAPFFYNRSVTYVDIGAYIGEVLTKLHQSKKLKIREAHLFEPNPISYKDLKNNILNLNITKLHTYNQALGREQKELLLSTAKSMSKILPEALQLDTNEKTTNVICCSLDSLIDLFTDRHIDILKIDVEGYELDVLNGATKIFESQIVDIIYIEVGFRRDGTQQTYFCEIDNFFQDYGYRVFKIYEQKNEWLQDSPLLRRCNFAYMSNSFASANHLKTSQELMALKEKLKSLNTSGNN
jgi:FkbM family methyltransferase